MKVFRIDGRIGIEAVLDLGERHIRKYQPHLEFERAVFRHYVTYCVEHPERYHVLVVTDDGHKPLGYCYATIEPNFFNRQSYFRCHAFYSEGGAFASKLLVKAMEKIAKREKCLELFISVDHGINEKRCLQFFEKLQYLNVGGTVKKNMEL